MYTIVIADDEEELRSAIVRRINWEEIGFLVVGEAENGIEALEMVGRLEPDLLLTDIRMPFISGIELARQVREVRPATQIAFLSGYDDFTYAQQAIQYNIISYLLKPITMAELTAELVQIKRRLDTIFAEFAQRKKETGGAEEFLLPLLMDSFQDSADKEREERLYKTAQMCIRDRSYCYQDSKDLARIQLKKVLSDHPNFVQGHLLLALLYMDMKEWEKARKELNRCLRIDRANTCLLYTSALQALFFFFQTLDLLI